MAAAPAALPVELAPAARDCLLQLGGQTDLNYVLRAARRARKWEHQADELV